MLKDMKFSLRVNRKTIESGIKNPPSRKDRDRQFHYISQMREAFANAGDSTISVDSKKRELIGNFKNGGKAWERGAVAVKDHDFPSDAEGVAVLSKSTRISLVEQLPVIFKISIAPAQSSFAGCA